MKRFLIPFIVLGMLFAALAPVSAGDVPPECIPDPIITFQHYGDNQVDLLFDPRLSTDCLMYEGAWPPQGEPEVNDPDASHEVQVLGIKVYHHERIGQTSDWDVSLIYGGGWEAWTGPAIAGQDFGGPYYSIGGGVNITGNSLAVSNCYVLSVEVYGLVRDDEYPGEWDNPFSYISESECVPGPDTIQVAEPFRERPGELIPLPDPTHGTRQPGSLKTGTSR